MICRQLREGNGTPLQYSCLANPTDGGAWWAAIHGVTKIRTWLSDFTFTFHFNALGKEMATRSSVLAWRIPGTGEPGGLLSMRSHRVRRLKRLSSSSIAVRFCPTEPPRKPPTILALASYCKDAFDVVASCRGHSEVSENPSVIHLFGFYAQSNNCSWNTSAEPRSCISRSFPIYLHLHRGNLKRLLK